MQNKMSGIQTISGNIVDVVLRTIKKGIVIIEEGKIKNKVRLNLNQFRGSSSEEAGSKIENKLFIIFRLGLWFGLLK